MDLRGYAVTFLDTAGLRETEDRVEAIGIGRARARAASADLRVILLKAPGDRPELEPHADDIVVVAKSDLIGSGDISAVTGQGIDTLVDRVARIIGARASSAGTAIRDRHRQAMIAAKEALGSAQDRLDSAPELVELIAEDLRTAIRALDSLVGRVDVEHILDEIFASFCIGK
jgi:tRNA modification GTPase